MKSLFTRLKENIEAVTNPVNRAVNGTPLGPLAGDPYDGSLRESLNKSVNGEATPEATPDGVIDNVPLSGQGDEPSVFYSDADEDAEAINKSLAGGFEMDFADELSFDSMAKSLADEEDGMGSFGGDDVFRDGTETEAEVRQTDGPQDRVTLYYGAATDDMINDDEVDEGWVVIHAGAASISGTRPVSPEIMATLPQALHLVHELFHRSMKRLMAQNADGEATGQGATEELNR